MKLYETINAENWVQGQARSGGRRCLSVWAWEKEQVVRSIVEAIRMLYPDRAKTPGFMIRDFNDHPDTTVDDVIRVCKTADV